MKLDSSTLVLTALFAPLACSPADEAVESERTSEAPAIAPDPRIEVSATMRKNLGITFTPVELRHVAQTRRVPGAFELQPLARHEYRMALPGRVQLLVDQYDAVEPGDVLFRYESPEWPKLLHEVVVGEQAMAVARAEIDVLQAKIHETRERRSLVQERISSLAKADFKKADLVTQAGELSASLPRLAAELELAETRLANAKRTRAHALHRASTAAGFPEAELGADVQVDGRRTPKYTTIDWIEVRAFDAGIVETLAVTDGSFVESTAAVLTTVDPKLVRFRALALQADLPAILGTREATIVPPPAPGIPIGAGVEATVTIGLEAHPEERTFTLLAMPKATAPWVRAGVSAFLEVVLDASAGPALAVPRSAVVQDGLTHVFFRRDPDDPDHVERVEADLGVTDGRWVVLESGVARGDEVVLSGAYELKLASQGSGARAAGGHVHADGSIHEDH